MSKDGPPTLPRVTVVVVSYNTKDLLRTCLAALQDVHEVVVVDNASMDGSPAMVEAEFPRAKLIANRCNVGFGVANNQGLDEMSGDVALLLNSDAMPQPGAISRLAEAMSDPSVIGCGGRLQFPDGRDQPSACSKLTLWRVFCEQTYMEKLFARSRALNSYWLSRWLPRDQTSEVEQVMGACLMFRPVERFDPRFFLYCEDTELCLRLRRHGSILFVPDALFTHHLGASTAGTRWESVARYNRGKELYFSIHGSKIAAAICWTLDRSGALLRLLTHALMFNRAKVKLWWKVLTAPVSGPLLPPDSSPTPSRDPRP